MTKPSSSDVTGLLEPDRWSDQPPGAPTPERSLGAALRSVRDATEPSQVQLQRLAVRRSIVNRSRNDHARWRVAVVAVVILCAGSAVGAAALMGWRYISISRPRGPTDGRSATGVSARDKRGRGHRERPVGTASSGAPDGVASERAGSPPDPAPEWPSSPPVVAPALEPSEAAALSAAFRELRSTGDARAALRLLDDHDRRFPAGTLRGEAQIARAEALIALGRRKEALPWLEGIEASGTTPTRDLRITRAELLAEAGRCPDALGDFDAVLTSSSKDGAMGRALYGRASCRLRAGETAAARADLQRYVATFPDGPAVGAARRALESRLP